MAKKIKLVRVYTSRLKNEEHLRFHTENEKLYRTHLPEQLGIDEFMGDYRQALATETAAVERIRKSAETAHIADTDKRFGTTFASLRLYVQLYLTHTEKDMQRSAERLHVIMQKYGNIGRRAYRAQLSTSCNLVQALRRQSDDIKKIGMEPWINKHEAAAQQLATQLDGRTHENAGKSKLKAFEARAVIDGIYQNITDRIDSMINIRGKAYAPEFIDLYNAHAIEYKNTLSMHLGKVHKKYDEGQLTE